MKLFAALWAAALSATLGGSFLGAPLPSQNIDASFQDSASAVNQVGPMPASLNMLAPAGNVPGPMSLGQAVSTFQHRAGIIDDMYDASKTRWLQPENVAMQSPEAEVQRPQLGMESLMSNMVPARQNFQQQQLQLPELQPLPMLQQLPQSLSMEQQLSPPQRDFSEVQQLPQTLSLQQQLPQAQREFSQTQQFPQVQQMDLLQGQPLPPLMQVPQSSGVMQQSATSFITEPLAGGMQLAPLVNADELFRDSSLPREQNNLMEPSAPQPQMQPQWGGKSLLSLLGEGRGQGFGPTDPPRESPWIAMSDPTREPPTEQFQLANPNTMAFGQLGQANTISFGQQQPGMMPFGSDQSQGGSNMMGFGNFGQPQLNAQQLQPQMNPEMMRGGSNMMALEQQAIPGNTGCILCHSQAAQEAPANKWADYFAKGEDDKRKHDEAFE